ncbi:uncharacterized protein LOC100889012 isoform X2 [Strongylocentrotus purpuratus]|uniref:Uncharacterized protein n=1 Tax=Strongylocentrotus purpuratus TaxID=7668 RepID=A0A7M7T1T7_STRPU|nr:uncharacterized protein LOC100889012 isoform X2 [Strongylocentrotus purpuratus]
MPMGTRRSSRRIAGGTESEGDQSDSSSQSSPRKRVSRSAKKTTKSKISEEKIKSIPEESLNFDITDASTPVKNKHNVSLDKDKQGSNTPQPLDIPSVASESVKSVDCSSDSKEKSAEKTTTTDMAHSKKRSAKETTTTEVAHSKKGLQQRLLPQRRYTQRKGLQKR